MTDADLFTTAVEHAKSIAFWRDRAAEAGQRERSGVARGPFHLTRRQCLVRMRYGQARVVDLAIVAEKRAGQAARNP